MSQRGLRLTLQLRQRVVYNIGLHAVFAKRLAESQIDFALIVPLLALALFLRPLLRRGLALGDVVQIAVLAHLELHALILKPREVGIRNRQQTFELFVLPHLVGERDEAGALLRQSFLLVADAPFEVFALRHFLVPSSANRLRIFAWREGNTLLSYHLRKKQLDARGITYEYLDGQTQDRQRPVQRFQTDPDCKLFLISLKAGGVGLNLTAAEYVFLLDPWWNPAVEAQAIDRAHRIGQKNTVFAYRLIAKDTVEEKVLQLQSSKRELADAIINQDNSVIGALTADDLKLLLS